MFWLGIIATGFAIIPVFSAVKLGRWIDRGNDARAIWIGKVLILVACVGFWLWPRSAMHLVGLSVLLGFGHMFCMAGHQMLMVARRRAAQPRERARLLHDRRRDRAGRWAVRGGLARRLAAAAADRAAVRHRPRRRGGERGDRAADQAGPRFRSREERRLVPIGALLQMRGLPAIFLASVVTVTALDLLVIYLPALGAERQIDANNIGLLLTVRSVASLVSRMFYARLIFAFGRVPLTLVSMLVSAAAFVILALPLSLPAMYAVLVVLGFGMGIASTLDDLGRRLSRAGRSLRHGAHAAHDRQPHRPGGVPRARRPGRGRDRRRRHIGHHRARHRGVRYRRPVEPARDQGSEE